MNFNLLNNIIKIILGLFLLTIIFNRIVFNINEFFYPFPREYRDGALIDIANTFLQGKNPYLIENSLPHTYTYGFIMPLFISFLYLILGKLLSLFYITKIINLSCLVLIIYFVIKQLKKYKTNILLILLSIAFILFYNFVTLRPENLAILLSFIALYIAQNSKKITKNKILILSAITIILFFIKQYFLIIFITLSVYFCIFRSKKNLILYLLFFTLSLLISFFLVNHFLPLYFPHTLINHMNLYNTHNLRWMVLQFKEFFLINFIISVVFIISSLITLLRIIKINKIKINYKSINIRFLDLKNDYINIYFISTLINIITLILLLGQHTGTYMTYFYQLLTIPLIINVIFFINKISYRHNYIIYIFIIIFILNYKNYLFPIKIDNKLEEKTWKDVLVNIRGLKALGF